MAHDLQVRLEIELEHAQRMRHVLRRVGDRDERHHHVALLHVVLDPLLVDRDVAFDEVKAAGIGRQIPELVVGEVDPVDLPRRIAQNRVGKRAADEAVRSEDHDFQCHLSPSALLEGAQLELCPAKGPAPGPRQVQQARNPSIFR